MFKKIALCQQGKDEPRPLSSAGLRAPLRDNGFTTLL